MASKTPDSNPQANILDFARVTSISKLDGEVLYRDNKVKDGVADLLKQLGQVKDSALITPGSAFNSVQPLAKGKDKALV
jgi:hypothetical protein